MLCTVLKVFNLSSDGLNTQPVIVGQVVEVRDDLVGGLVAEGFVALRVDDVGTAAAPASRETKVVADDYERGEIVIFSASPGEIVAAADIDGAFTTPLTEDQQAVLDGAEGDAAIDSGDAAQGALSEPLTDVEVNADLEAMNVEFDPRDTLEARTAQRDAARAERDLAMEATVTFTEAPAADVYPDLSPAQETALDRDGDGKPGGSLKAGAKTKAKG